MFSLILFCGNVFALGDLKKKRLGSGGREIKTSFLLCSSLFLYSYNPIFKSYEIKINFSSSILLLESFPFDFAKTKVVLPLSCIIFLA
jgi:hypothetical protein